MGDSNDRRVRSHCVDGEGCSGAGFGVRSDLAAVGLSGLDPGTGQDRGLCSLESNNRGQLVDGRCAGTGRMGATAPSPTSTALA